MKNRVWIHLVMAVLVAGLFLLPRVQKNIVSDATNIEDQAMVDAKARAEAFAAEASAKAKAEADRIAQQKLEDQMSSERALMESKTMAAKKQFENQDIHFEFDSSELSSMTKTILKEKAAWLRANSSVFVTVEGHCDERGTTEYNLALGERRASVAKVYLVDLGISVSRLNTISYGEEKPKETDKTEAAYRANRRAHFAID